MADWKKNTVHEGEITGYTAEGMGVARLDGRVVFIPGTIAGERWRFRLEKVNKTVAWGRGIEVLSRSGANQIVPFSVGAAAASFDTWITPRSFAPKAHGSRTQSAALAGQKQSFQAF